MQNEVLCHLVEPCSGSEKHLPGTPDGEHGKTEPGNRGGMGFAAFIAFGVGPEKTMVIDPESEYKILADSLFTGGD